jgi:heterodisulfide reductase subunit A
VEKNIIILGAGVAGLTASVELSKLGIPVTLIEKEENIGGHPLKFTCKATDKCSNCGLCQFNEVLKEMKNSKKINLLTSSELQDLEGNFGNFIATLSQRNAEKINTFKIPGFAIIVATGAEVYDARHKSQFGYKIFKNVITGLELEEKLRSGSESIKFNGKVPKEIAFIQCVGSRDENIKKGYCSKVCCRYAIRMANVLKEKIKDVNITIFYMDLQTTGKDIFSIYSESKDKFEFINSIPTYVKEKNGELEVRYEDIKNGKMGYRNFDLLVLSVGISANRENKNLAKILGVNLNRFGFYDVINSCETNVEGIFLAGTSIAPMSIVDSISSAKSAVYSIISKFGG